MPNGGTFYGTADDDTIIATRDDDVLAGLTGNDNLLGGAGSDTYIYASGDGNDVIIDEGNAGDTDTLVLTDLNAADIAVTLAGMNILLTVIATGEVINLNQQFSDATTGIEQIQFADGTIWDRGAIEWAATHHDPTGAVTVYGDATENQVLIANTSTVQDPEGIGGFHYQWQSSLDGTTWSDVGTDAATYALGDGDVGLQFRVVVSYTDGYGTAASLTSDVTEAVANVNDAPLAVDDNAAVNVDAGAAGNVLANDTDPDAGDHMRITAAQFGSSSQPIGPSGALELAGAYGTLTLASDGSYSYSPDNAAAHHLPAGVEVSEVFTYTVVDDQGASATATLTFNITGIANTVVGTAGDDTLVGTKGDDTLIGQDGNDVLIGGAGGDTLIGGDGIDTASYADATAGVQANLGPDPRGTFSSPIPSTGDAAGDTYSGIENLTGSKFDDALNGDGNANVLDGGNGNDFLFGAAGDDMLIGGAGADMLAGDDGIDTVSYADAQSRVVASLATKTGTLGDAAGDRYDGIENLVGSAFDDTLTGDDGANKLVGGAGNDILVGGYGADILFGDDGRDTASYQTAFQGVTANLAASALNTGQAYGDQYYGIEDLRGSDYADVLTGDAGDNTLDGGSGNDLLAGGGGRDTYIGGAGIDTVSFAASSAGVGVNLLSPSLNFGDAARDTFSQVENLTGTAFADELTGDTNANVLDGGAGDDVLSGGSGNDILIGGAGADVLDGGAGTDTVSYATATIGVTASLVPPSPSPSYVNPNTGDAKGDKYTSVENLTGSSFADKLIGNTGNNVIEGGAGNDTLTGGGGNDTFVFHAGFGQDTILDFSEGVGVGDVIQVDRTIFANFTAVTSHAHQVGTSLVISDGVGNSITLSNATLAGLAADDFLFV